MLNTTGQTFQSDVISASHEVPVLVDFWAPWCGPCRALGPMLERLEQDSAGRFRLVKINSDENPELSAQFNVRSIPYVVAFVDGQPVDSFVGVLPESQLRAFIDRVAPNPSEIERRKAAALAEAGDRAGALASVRAALALDSANDDARLDLAQIAAGGRGDTERRGNRRRRRSAGEGGRADAADSALPRAADARRQSAAGGAPAVSRRTATACGGAARRSSGPRRSGKASGRAGSLRACAGPAAGDRDARSCL